MCTTLLRLWGARIGRLTYWAAGLRILDRSFICIGDDVIFGAGVRLNPHVMLRNDRGELELILATVNIGDRVVVGGYSLLTAGTVIAPDAEVKVYLVADPAGRALRRQAERPEIGRLTGARVLGLGGLTQWHPSPDPGCRRTEPRRLTRRPVPRAAGAVAAASSAAAG